MHPHGQDFSSRGLIDAPRGTGIARRNLVQEAARCPYPPPMTGPTRLLVASCCFGMSGLGKTHLAKLLRDGGDWFHYSVDYRIGTRYMGEYIADNFKREAMRVPLLRELLLTDSVYISSNITFDNLAPLSTYLGKPGDPRQRRVAL